MPSDFSPFDYVTQCRIGLSLEARSGFLKWIMMFSLALKSDPAGGLSRLDGPFAEMYRYQWRTYRLR
jgi:hypothetical protein